MLFKTFKPVNLFYDWLIKLIFYNLLLCFHFNNHLTLNIVKGSMHVLGCFYPAGNYMFKVNNRKTRTKC